MSISMDGFVAGPEQSLENPLGVGGLQVHRWHIGDERATEADEIATGWLMRPRGAYVMGRNMFGPIRGEWDDDWKGWWGPEPPYHAPVFVLTHHAHEPIEMEGGTTLLLRDRRLRCRVRARPRGRRRRGCRHCGRRLDRAAGARRRCGRRAHARYRAGAAGIGRAHLRRGSSRSGSSPSRCCTRRWPRTCATGGRTEADPGVSTRARRLTTWVESPCDAP